MFRSCGFLLWTAIAAAAVIPAETLVGAGATFPYPIYAKWFDAYQAAHRDTEISYRAVGSGDGIKSVTAGSVDFGASDGPLTDEQLQAAAASLKTSILHFPTVLGAVVPAYNLPELPASAEVRFTPEALSGIFLGTVKRWNDPVIARANPGLKLPNKEIVVVHRADGSGTTYCWTDYLSKVSPEWKTRVGTGTTVNWPVGQMAMRNEGVAGLVKQTSYALGYVELTYAIQNKISYGQVQNAAGEFVKATGSSVAAAGDAVANTVPDHFRVSITNPAGKGVYPISTFTWLLVPAHNPNTTPAKRKALIGFLRWMLTDGQKLVESADYVPLPQAIVAKELKQIEKIH